MEDFYWFFFKRGVFYLKTYFKVVFYFIGGIFYILSIRKNGKKNKE